MIKPGFRLMKSPRTLALCAAAALAPLALADEPALSAPALGITEATLDFCARINPQSADQYWQHGKRLVQGVPAKTAAEIRKSEQYRQAYDSTAEQIGNISRQDAMQACVDSLAANK